MSKCWRSTSIRSTSIKSINISSTSISSIYTCIIYCCQWNISILQNNLILHLLHFEMQCFSKTSLWHVNFSTTHLTQSTILNKIVSSQECWHLMGGFLLCVSLFSSKWCCLAKLTYNGECWGRMWFYCYMPGRYMGSCFFLESTTTLRRSGSNGWLFYLNEVFCTSLRNSLQTLIYICCILAQVKITIWWIFFSLWKK